MWTNDAAVQTQYRTVLKQYSPDNDSTYMYNIYSSVKMRGHTQSVTTWQAITWLLYDITIFCIRFS